MSASDRYGSERPEAMKRAVVSALFGDRTGLLLFVGALVFFTLLLRVGVFVNDSFTVVNAMLAVADGHLHIKSIQWGPNVPSPGLHFVGGRTYGRNYGQAFLALPFYWGLKAVAGVADLRVALVAGWSLLVLGFFDQLGRALDREKQLRVVGSVVALGLFAGNLAVARPLSSSTIPALALEIQTMVAAAFIGVFIYRLVESTYDTQIGAFAGAAVLLATPVGFWASFPKRHSITALATVLVLYSLHRARTAEQASSALRFRALTYAVVGATAWTHAPEAFILFVGLAVVDVGTDLSLEPGELALVASVFLLVLIPFFVTNVLISGNPIQPPRMLPDYPNPGATTFVPNPTATPGSEQVAGPAESPDAASSSDTLSAVIGVISTITIQFIGQLTSSLVALFDAKRVSNVFIRGGYTAKVPNSVERLSMLESAPILGATVALPLFVYKQIKSGINFEWSNFDSKTVVDALVVMYSILFVLVYWPRLPIRASVTVRYLHPLYPMGVYLLVRIPSVRNLLRNERQVLLWTYAVVTLIGGQLFVAVLLVVPETRPEMIQLHALIAVFSAGVLLVWVALFRGRLERFGAVSLASTAAVTTWFLVLSSVAYFRFGQHMIPVVRMLYFF